MIPSPRDQNVSTIVIRVTGTGVENHVVNYGQDSANAPEFFDTFRRRLLRNVPGRALLKVRPALRLRIRLIPARRLILCSAIRL